MSLMADEQFRGQGQWSGQNKTLGTGEGETPLAPSQAPKIDIRTMASDQKSMQEGNTPTPRPYVPPPAPLSPSLNAPPNPSMGVPQPDSRVFKPPQIDSTPIPPPPIPADFKKIKTAGKKNNFALIIILAVLVAAGVLGYFFVYPKFFKQTATNENPPPENPPPNPPAPVCGDGTCDISESADTCAIDCQPTPPSPPPALEHVSLFKISADLTANEGENIPTDLAIGSIVEILTSYSKISESLNDVLKAAFSETEYTSFVYAGKNNALTPGMIFKIKSGGDLEATKTAWSDFVENSQFYLTQSLSQAGGGEPKTWKTGQTSGVPNRYLSFTNPGFAINYGWINDTVILTSSYEGFKEAIRRAQ